MKMTQLNLTETEVPMLRRILESYRSDLRMEIADTEEMDFRETLKEEEALLERILETLAQ